MRKLMSGLPLVAVCLLISCIAAPTLLPTAAPLPPVPSSPPTAIPLRVEDIVMSRANEVIRVLGERDTETLSTLIHPAEGVRFSPYTFVRESDLVFIPDQIGGLLTDPTQYVWGIYDGSGLPIELTFVEYYDRFVYDQDFTNAEQIGYDQTLGTGNTINNCSQFYPQAVVVEYHFSGFDPNLAGMDWRSLRLVLKEEGGVWYLVGIVHDEWTI